MPSKTRGFTLIELLIGLLLTAIVLSLAVPGFSRFLAGQRVTVATNELMANLQYARNEALTRHQIVIACPSPDHQDCEGNRWDRGWIVFVDPDRNGSVEAPEQILRVMGPNDHARMHSGGRYRVRFRPSGSAYGSNLTIRVCDPQARVPGRAVVVSNPGRARVERRLSPADCAT
ncbi:GspH/FimT family pseudopilin [Wenzhouxiangella marina]|uniref:Type II secretion system protein H n=1 Tax=Wenzhouxiangella marina TaxID=1579979 RepID=A0A0K0XX66_9GAMM|nr:GspH/FimT family pseudopilin [Wenzhouxiangella marina]AKS42278.1 hypothetical protein WM2015_1912 [Wenzhouxiangella marina]MBB6085949.1 type IV fimbrial biogenesis protein FimT [Wenzhouxiangella marina]